MKRVLTAAVLIPLVLLAVFRAPLWLFALLIAAIVVLALKEYLHLVEAYGITPIRWLTYTVSILLLVPMVVVPLQTASEHAYDHSSLLMFTSALRQLKFALPMMLALLFGVPVVFRRDLRMAVAASATSAFGVLYITLPFTMLIYMRWEFTQQLLVIFVLFSVWAGDIAAYYIGKNFGRHKLAPIVSPNKSWEGAIASALASMAVAWLISRFGSHLVPFFKPLQTTGFYTPVPAPGTFFTESWIEMIILGFITNVAAQFGDLFESALKRGAHVKDSGSLLPGHGGILDRIDALFFAIPVAWYYASSQSIWTFFAP
jgi:phosphatidate cytidylyltransferase